MKTKDITLVSICSAILVISKQILVFLPNVQIITLLVLVFSKTFSNRKSILIITIFVIIDSLIMGSFNLLYFPATWLGWLLIPISINTFFKTENIYALSIFGLIHSSVFGFLFLIPKTILTDVDVKVYILMDIPFQIVMGLTSFLTILFLYEPLKQRILQKL